MDTKPEALKTVKPLRETKSKYDLVVDGKTFRFEIMPCKKGGIDVVYIMEQKLKDAIPKFLQKMIPGPEDEQIVTEVVGHECIVLKWWEKSIGITLESKAEKWAIKQRKELERRAAAKNEAERIRQKIG